MKKLSAFMKSEIVLVISLALAFVSSLFVPPSSAYWGYVDFRVLCLLFCLMATVKGLSNVNAFEVMSQFLVKNAKGTRSLSLMLVMICFFSSMFITNDVALITFVPLSISILRKYDHKNLIFVIVMQTIAANLGSMLTPVGNPQNLYLFSFYGLKISEFLKMVIPLGAISLVLIVLITLSIKNTKCVCDIDTKHIEDKTGFMLYFILFLLCLLTVFDIVHYLITLVIVSVSLIFKDKSVFKRLDYILLLTFVAFFIFTGNVASIQAVKDFISSVIVGKELICSALLSQAISNVPTAFMLSAFTDNAAGLVQGTNIGGLGTVVASLASLISFKLYSQSADASRGRYLVTFTVLNFSLLILLILISLAIQ